MHCISSLRCSTCSCNTEVSEEQTKGSIISRVTAVAFGSLLCLIGVLVLFKIPFLHALGSTGGIFCTSVGGIIALMGICLKQVKEQAPKQRLLQRKDVAVQQFPDVRAHGCSRVEGSGLKNTVKKNTTYVDLKEIVNSTENEDIELFQTISSEYGISVDQVREKLKKNLGNDLPSLSLPLTILDGERDNRELTYLLKLLCMSDEEVYALTYSKLELFSQESKNILHFRLEYCESFPQNEQEDSLGSLLVEKKVSSFELPQETLEFLGSFKLNTFISDASLSQELVLSLFPTPASFPHTCRHSLNMLLTIPKDNLNKVIPFLDPIILDVILKEREDEVDCNFIQENKIKELFPVELFGSTTTEKRLEGYSTELIQKLLPKMNHEIFKLIPRKHLKSKELDLTNLDPTLIKKLFVQDQADLKTTRNLVASLSNKNRKYVDNILKRK